MTALLPARVALAIGVDRLLAQRLQNALERARLLAAEKEDRGAAADDRLRVILIHGTQLALRLHEDMRRDVAAPDDGNQPPAIGERRVTEDVAYEKSVICRCETMYDALYEVSKRGLHAWRRDVTASSSFLRIWL